MAIASPWMGSEMLRRQVTVAGQPMRRVIYMIDRFPIQQLEG